MSLVEDNRSSQEVGTDPEQPVEVGTLATGTSESSEMSKLLADSETFSGAPLVPGEVVQGEIVKVADGEVVISLRLKTEATAPVSEFLNSEGQVSVAPGDKVDIWIEQYDDVTGRVEISHQKAVHRKVWEDI
ncbi:MAG TPA: S1 RNA-binding domain-containing protein, partial [Terriglobia bacterium]|nr:S1 RNA-binding domain-containing protein [Terriglobia bacterium]